MSAFAAWAARNTLRPMRPKPLIPTRTGMAGPYLRSAAHHLDAVAVRIAEIGRVVAGAVLRARARPALVAAAVRHCRCECRVDRRLARGRDRDVPERRPVRTRPAAARDEPQLRAVDAVRDRA